MSRPSSSVIFHRADGGGLGRNGAPRIKQKRSPSRSAVAAAPRERLPEFRQDSV